MKDGNTSFNTVTGGSGGTSALGGGQGSLSLKINNSVVRMSEQDFNVRKTKILEKYQSELSEIT